MFFVTSVLILNTVLIAIIIIASFINLSGDLTIEQSVRMVNTEIDILKYSLMLSCSIPLYFMAAFYFSKQQYDKYKNELIGFNIAVPFILIFLLFPSADELPLHLEGRFNLLLFGTLAMNWITTKLLADKIWVMGGRGGSSSS